ncbi:PspC domain-containing protein [Leptotrichia sp. HSP-334]|uniref:PspC domain-containing protein n=1 Tax=Leptotrichia rugosa TaxID=3239302 RepID=A0AB39VGT8_9FUSO|nr:PspC domain-containing protein [uncultured Leptotrichia sp.]
MEKKLYKSLKDRKIAGVCGGIAEYLNIDSNVIRIIWVIFAFGFGTGILAYIICALILSDNPSEYQ